MYSIPAARATGQYFAFYQHLDKSFPLIATADIGRIGAEILLQSWEGNRIIEISGPTYYSSNDVAAALERFSIAPSSPSQYPVKPGLTLSFFLSL